ncbi:hypothetical protein Smp_166780 [Schistosoma mansoni]|uniref:hypothetical protein n=1 Tax=Schistosoma mansoni TaxID=6183 RepID=UPI00022DC769|nr:hypothetical protein Smp_166780 [Schistosoma mansoni]|eukprot:XP_018650719.1 hypothetical protein Smp_166780 [Schistosoma mansoni]
MEFSTEQINHRFSFKALNFSDKHSSCDLDSSNSSNFGANDHGNSHLPERVGHAILSNDYQSATPKTTIIPSVCKSSDLGEISPNVISLLKPTKARESEEVRVIKLYHIALRLCSSDCPDDEPKARPVLESILNSFVIESNKLTPQLASVKFASCKLLGGIYFKLNKDAEGIDLLSKALQVDSNDLSLWIRLARAAIRSGFFEVAVNSIDHILTKRPSHPLALQLALPLYFAVSELEICLELSVRMLQIDPFSEYAVYFINRILTIQPIYRKQKDAETEPQKIPLVKFPSPLKHLSWLHLIQETITMYDRLNMESAIHSVLDLTSLLCKNLLNFESVPNEINEVSNNTVTTSSSSASFNSKLGEQLNDNIEHAVNSNIEKVPNVDAVYDTMKDDVGDLNIEASNDDLNATAGLEKRRSSRVRTCFDLTDGLNRYCSRRSVVAELEKVSDKCKPSSEKLASSQKESDYVNDRFKLIDRFQTLLPQVFRDLGVFDQKQKLSKELQTTTETLIPCTDSFTEISSNCSECVTSNFSNMWSQKSVHEFLVLLNNMKPNIITFGISLLLQTSRLSGYRWSLEFATEYLNLFDRLQPSFPYLLTTPPSSSFSSSSLLLKAVIDQNKIQPETCLLPEDVLALKVAPELHHLAFFYIIYIELYLEELESTSHNSTKSKEKISRPTEIPTPVFSVLNDLLAGFEETSSDYPIVMSHLLWMHYLMSSQRRDYVEMKECVLALKKLIIEHKLVVVRSYSVHHGDLTVDYMNHLLIKLKDVSSFDHLIQLSNEGQHEAVVTELIKTFQIQRNINSKPSSSDPYDHYQSIIKQLDLCYGSLKHLIMNLTLNNDKIVKNSISTENNQLDSFNNHDDDYDMSVDEMNSNKITSWLTISEACRTVTVLIDLLICIIRTSVNLLSNWKMNFYLQLISLIYEHLYCIENSIPCSALPIELRIYRFDAEFPVDYIPFELKVNAYSGTVSAPPSIACLHLFHELSLVLFAYNQMSSVNIPCRDCPDLLKLLVQIVIRSSRQLQLLSAKFYSPDLRTYLETGNRSDYPTDKIISFNKVSTECSTILQTNEEFVNPVSPDDNTIACTDDLQKSITYKSWPIDCVCLTQVLSCAVKCLLGGSLTREITTVYQSTMEKYLFLELLESSDFAKLFDSIKNKSVDNYVNFLPEWINTLKNLYTSSDIFDHPYLQQPIQQNSLNKPNWWNPATIDDQQRSLDWECVKVIFLISYPNPFPEYDSIKTLSISTEMLKFLCDASKLISTSESKKILPKSEIDMIIQSKVKDTQHLPSVPKGLSFLTKSMYYLIADHYMKNNHFDRAVEYYLQDLRVSPQRVDTWASLGLIYSSELEQVLNLTNLKTERVSAEAVTRCLRCFNVALYLQPDTVTLLIERGCLAYQLHSYGARIVKKSEYRNFPDAHLNLCRKWRYRMLQLARSSYEKNYLADNNNNNTSKLVQQSKEEEEAWLCHYMLAKCAEKDVQLMKQSDDIHSSISSKSSSSSRSYLMHVLHLYYESLKALDLAGAKYPKKIIVYNKIPFRAVEAIEVYYRIHALSLKTLLKHGPPPPTTTTVTNQSSKSTYSMYPINLIELDQFLTMINSSDFVTSAKKPSRRTRKRTANMAGLSTKHNHLQKSVNQLGSCENHNKQMEINETNITESNADKLVQPLDNKLNTISSQDEFIDLVSPDPHIVVDEEESTNLLEPSSSRSSINECANKLGLWKKCIDRSRCALELVLQRLPLHYKAMYRLASLYLHASHLKDPSKALDILLGPTDESQKHLASIHVNTLNNNNNVNTTNTSTHLNIGGLFKDRKQNNFFYGVWRIPTADIDRSGNFAAHMYRSVCLTLSLLHDHGDWRRLVQIFHQLRKQPPEEKRGFLGEGDRVYLARRAFNLIQPTLLNWLTQLSLLLANKISEQILKDHTFAFSSDISCITTQGFLTNEILIQIYRLHCVSYSRNSSTSSSCSCSSSSSTTTSTTANSSGVLDSTLNSLNSSLYSPTTNNTTICSTTINTTNYSGTSTPSDVNTILAAEISGYASVLQLAYRLCPTVWDSRGPLVPLDWILQRCSELAASRSQTGVADSSSK